MGSTYKVPTPQRETETERLERGRHSEREDDDRHKRSERTHMQPSEMKYVSNGIVSFAHLYPLTVRSVVRRRRRLRLQSPRSATQRGVQTCMQQQKHQTYPMCLDHASHPPTDTRIVCIRVSACLCVSLSLCCRMVRMSIPIRIQMAHHQTVILPNSQACVNASSVVANRVIRRGKRMVRKVRRMVTPLIAHPYHSNHRRRVIKVIVASILHQAYLHPA